MKKEEATKKTTAMILNIARREFTEYGYTNVSLEKIAEQGNVTRGAVYHHFKSKKGLFLNVLACVQKDIAQQIEKEAIKSHDPWQQLVLGCIGFIKGANAKDCRRILLVDAPAMVGWDMWRKVDRENSMDVLQQHIVKLMEQGYLEKDVDTQLMTQAISGALNELALNYPVSKTSAFDRTLEHTVATLVYGFKKKKI